jgi:hypothetical protein
MYKQKLLRIDEKKELLLNFLQKKNGGVVYRKKEKNWFMSKT